MVQRSYNASIVRIAQEDAAASFRLPANPSAATPAATAIDTSNSGNSHTPNATVNSTRNAINGIVSDGITGGNGEPNAEVTTEVVPEGESQEGILGLEIRIRLYEDGAMSQLLEQLARVRCSLRHAIPYVMAGVTWYQQEGVRFVEG